MSIWPILNGLVDLMAPRACASCDEALDPSAPGPFCDGCEILLEPAEGKPDAAFLYGGPLAEAIRSFKYSARTELASPLSTLLVERALELSGEVDVVTSVPLHPRRLRARGYDQAALLARPVAVALDAPFRPRLLRRIRDTPPQAGLDAEARPSNVRGAFRAECDAPGRVLLIDDVRTTGATLAVCAERLRHAGAERVHTLVLARAET